MNIQSLFEDIKLFKKLVLKSGFKRDIKDYLESLPSNEENVLALRDIANSVLSVLNEIQESDLPHGLRRLFKNQDIPSFTDNDAGEKLERILADKEIEREQFYSDLREALAKLSKIIDRNETEIDRIEDFLKPYADKDPDVEEGHSIVSIIFYDLKTTESLSEFGKIVSKWNMILLIYHQMITSSSPTDIQIVEVQNGSIDVLINLDIDVAINLVDLFKLGFQVFGAYLTYKKMIKPMTDLHFGNPELNKLEKEKEKHFLGNIETTIVDLAKNQSKLARKEDKNIPANVTKMAKEVSKMVTDHIVKGNDLKLITAHTLDEDLNEEQQAVEKKKEELRKESRKVRTDLRLLSESEKMKLIKKYAFKDEPEAK